MSKEDEYTDYLRRVEAHNIDVDYYDGDIYIAYQEPLSYEDWLEDLEDE